MKNFSKIVLIAVIILGMVSVSEKIYSQEDGLETMQMDENQIVYWFNIGVHTRKHKKFGYQYYKVRSYGERVYNAPLREYGRKLWGGLRQGRFLSIGPFTDYFEAEQAEKFYGRDSVILDTSIDKSRTVYWFMLRVYRRPRSNSYDIMKIPAMVSSGSYKNFILSYNTGLVSGPTLAIGPFWSYDEAEEAKRRYRLQSSSKSR